MRVVRADAARICPDLFQVLGAYLHQDFDLDHGTAGAALDASMAEHPIETLRAALRQLRQHRPDRRDEAGTASFVNSLCDYHPPGDGHSYVEWLDEVEALLQGAASA